MRPQARPAPGSIRFVGRLRGRTANLRSWPLSRTDFGIGVCQVPIARRQPDLVWLLPAGRPRPEAGRLGGLHENLRTTPPYRAEARTKVDLSASRWIHKVIKFADIPVRCGRLWTSQGKEVVPQEGIDPPTYALRMRKLGPATCPTFRHIRRFLMTNPLLHCIFLKNLRHLPTRGYSLRRGVL
jgi:hypothetical protein